MLLQRPAARVLEPLDAVIRLDDEVVQRVAVGEQDVEITVPVQIRQLLAGRSQFGCGAAYKRLHPEAQPGASL